ncbi:MAG: hypothetical protein FIA99_18680 [Ruminiclostridium sp.]|nr:hypothetical protein [Ruminiclostridium sp.]
MKVKRTNSLPNIRDLFSYGMGEKHANEGKNFAFDNCMEYLMEKLGEKEKLNYWVITGITGNGYTPVYNRNDSTAACEYCVSGYLAGSDYIGYVFDAIGYEHTYITAERLNANKPEYLHKLMDYTKRGVPVIAIGNSGEPDFFIDSLTHYLYVGQEDYEKTFLFSRKADDELYNKLNAIEFIPQDLVFAGEKKHDIMLVDICRNAVMKIPYWLTMPERNGVFFGASAYRAWADDIEAGRYDGETHLWHNYVVYICNLATLAWANNVNDAPYASIVNRLSQLDTRYADMSVQIAKQFFLLGEEDGSSGFCKGGIWRSLEDLGGGFNCSLKALNDTKIRAKIVDKFREAAVCIDNVLQILQRNLTG